MIKYSVEEVSEEQEVKKAWKSYFEKHYNDYEDEFKIQNFPYMQRQTSDEYTPDVLEEEIRESHL